MLRRWSRSAIVSLGLVFALVGTAIALVTYSWSTAAVVGGTNQFATWMNSTHATAYTIDKTVTPAVTYTHNVYVSDYALDGTYTNDTKCAAGDCLANYYVRSTNGGKTWTNPVKVPAPANTPTDRGTLAAAGKTVLVAYVDQTSYYSGGGSTFDVMAPRTAWWSRNTNHGTGAWSAQKKLPGQSASSRVDYLNAWMSGTTVHIVTTDVDTGAIWYWRSTDKGATFAQPVVIGGTTFLDMKPISEGGYVGGYSGLPMVAASGTDVAASWVDDPSGKVVTAVSTNGGVTWSTETTLVASGGADNAGQVQMDARDSRIAVTWTTAAGGWLKIWNATTDSWGADHQFVSFPDTDPGVGTVYNKGGENAVVALGPGSVVGIALSECNQLASGAICSDNLTNNKTREQLVWRTSDDYGATWSDPQVIGPVTSDKTTFINNYGDAIYIKSKPLALWNGHDAVYFNYLNYRKIGTPA